MSGGSSDSLSDGLQCSRDHSSISRSGVVFPNTNYVDEWRCLHTVPLAIYSTVTTPAAITPEGQSMPESRERARDCEREGTWERGGERRRQRRRGYAFTGCTNLNMVYIVDMVLEFI